MIQSTDGVSDFDLDELENAVRYQRWVAAAAMPWLGSRILEVGAGTGNMSRWLPIRDRLILTEPDDRLRALLTEKCTEWAHDGSLVSVVPFSPEADPVDRFADERIDTVVSFNVMEHVADDVGALRNLVRLLDLGHDKGLKRLVMFVPAHPWAYGSLDTAFGHERRYSRAGLRKLLVSVAPRATVTLRHFNVIGLPGWLVTGRVLRRTSIPPFSIRAFEAICPIVRPIDDFLHARLRLALGQSLIAVAEWS